MTGQINVNKIAARSGTTITVDTGDALDVTLVKGEGSATTNLKQGLGKFWINFNGTGTIAARDSFNFTSLTDNGTGDTTVTIANNMSNANYAHAGSSGGQNGTSNGSFYSYDQATARTTALFRTVQFNTSGAFNDTPIVECNVHGDLA